MNNMNSSNETGGLNLPPPVAEQSPVPAGSADKVETQPERTNLPAEKLSATAQSAPIQIPPIPMADPKPATQPIAQNIDDSSTTNQAKLDEDDGDLIEKEWVNVAKQIVERTKDDPYKQSEELTGVKADYLQKRYNKTLKLNK
jgi:hypothetical protein